jgi:cysteine desulfurase
MLAGVPVRRYYFDHNATTPVDARVLDAMLPCLREHWGNASSVHGRGQDARRLIENARAQVAGLLGCATREIVFTSGGTESDNLAILGSLRAMKRRAPHVITSTIEHPAVLETCRHLADEGTEVTFVRVGSSGVVDPDDVRRALRPETALISVMHANNELGTIQPVEEISHLAREAGALFHTDGVQSCGKIETPVSDLGVDFFAISAHKLYGPKGVGALYVRKGAPLEKVTYGGRHERGLRPGTDNTAGIAGLGAAAQLAREGMAREADRLAALRNRLQSTIQERIPRCWVNGGDSPRTPNTTNIGFEGIEGDALLIALDLEGFAVSSGAACSSGAVEPSHVLTAIGLSKERARSCLRFSLGKENEAEHVDALAGALVNVVDRLRKLSPAHVA